MLNPRVVHFWKLPVVSWWCSFLCVQAVVQVDFSHSYVGVPGGFQNAGAITLEFTVDATGAVVLDASCVETGPAAYVDSFGWSGGNGDKSGNVGRGGLRCGCPDAVNPRDPCGWITPVVESLSRVGMPSALMRLQRVVDITITGSQLGF